MSETTVELRGSAKADARALSARMRAGEARARAALALAIDDLFLPEAARVDDRTRAALGALLAALVGTVEGEVRDYGARLLNSRGEAVLAATLTQANDPDLTERLANAGLLRDPGLISECLARVRLELLGERLPPHAPDAVDAPSLVVRLSRSSDRVVAAAASALLKGESQRRAAGEGGLLAGTGLPSDIHHRLVWWVSAAIRDRASPVGDTTALDRALAEAAMRNLAAHDEGDRVESAAMRLAGAIGAQTDELPPLLVEALRDRRLAFFTALLADALGVAFDLVRDLVLDPAGDRLWMVLRALECPRDVLAEIGYGLAEADPRRDVEAFADTLDAIAGIEPETARVVVAPLRLHPDYRAALQALEAAEDRR